MKILRGIKTILTLLIALILASPAYAQTYFSSADAIVTCEKYLQMKETDPDIAGAHDLWVFGYVSGLNTANYHTRKVDLLYTQTRPDVLAFIKLFCSDDSSAKKTLKEAADKYWEQLSNQAKQQDE
jgi:hypothetical protein